MRLSTRAAIVLAGLLFHFYTRYEAQRAIPLSATDGFYPSVYRVSLSLIAGRGFNLVTFPDMPDAAPLREFTMMSRPQLSHADMDAYFRQPYSAPVHFDSLRRTTDVPVPPSDAPFLDDHYRTRVLDLRLAALVWKCFGIKWSVYFTFYGLVSTLAALCVFLIGRAAGGYWIGVVAMLFYTACPLENEYLIRSVRDISPLWFASFSLAFAVCLAGTARSRLVSTMSFVGAGVVAAIGYGWRPDALILPPFLLMFVTIRLILQQRRPAEILSAAGLFIVGTLGCLGGIRLLTPGGGISPEHGFHMAYYGHAARANLLGIEDSLNIYRDDIDTHVDAHYYAVANNLPGGGEPYLSFAYGEACRAMFLEAMRYDFWNLASRFPLFTFRAMRGTDLSDLPINTDYFAPPPRWTPVMATVRRLILDPLYWLTPYLTILGFIATLFWVRPAIVTAMLVALLLYYCIILLSVLPEYKHTGLLVLPISVLSAVAVTTIATKSWRYAKWKRGGLIFIAIFASWSAICGVAYPYSVRRRVSLIDHIRKASAGAPEIAGIRGPRLFVVHRDAQDRTGERVGYLLKIDAGANPGLLHSRSVRDAGDIRYYESNHNLLPSRKQYFFVTSYFGPSTRTFTNTILIDGDARILSAQKVDLRNWENTEVSTVFYDGNYSPGSPKVDEVSNRTVYGAPTLDEKLLTSDEQLGQGGLHVHQLVARGPLVAETMLSPIDTAEPMSVPADFLRPSSGAGRVLEPGLIHFTTPSIGGQVWLQSPSLYLDHEAIIYVRIHYRLRKGNVALAVFPTGGTPLICQQPQAVRHGDGWTETVGLRPHAGQTFFIVIANGYAPLDLPTDAEISEIQLYAE